MAVLRYVGREQVDGVWTDHWSCHIDYIGVTYDCLFMLCCAVFMGVLFMLCCAVCVVCVKVTGLLLTPL